MRSAPRRLCPRRRREGVPEWRPAALAALGPDGAEGAMGDALRWLEGAAEGVGDRLDGAVAALGRALAELDEAAEALDPEYF